MKKTLGITIGIIVGIILLFVGGMIVGSKAFPKTKIDNNSPIAIPTQTFDITEEVKLENYASPNYFGLYGFPVSNREVLCQKRQREGERCLIGTLNIDGKPVMPYSGAGYYTLNEGTLRIRATCICYKI